MNEAATSICVPTDVIDALCRLNTHARAYGCGKKAIYAYKTLAAALLVSSGEASAQLVQWTGTCGHCRGTGKYVDSYGETWPHCRQCQSTGRVTLKFVETTLSGGQTWHHPFEYGSGVELAAIAALATWDGQRGGYKDAKGNEAIFWNVASDWGPRQPAEKLIPDEAATHLNTVEAWVLTLESSAGAVYSMTNRATEEMRRYIIGVGRVGLQCWYCDSFDISCGLSRPGPPFAWSAPVCREHSSTPVSLWPHRAALPSWVITPPLREWQERHERIGFDRDTIFDW